MHNSGRPRNLPPKSRPKPGRGRAQCRMTYSLGFWPAVSAPISAGAGPSPILRRRRSWQRGDQGQPLGDGACAAVPRSGGQHDIRRVEVLMLGGHGLSAGCSQLDGQFPRHHGLGKSPRGTIPRADRSRRTRCIDVVFVSASRRPRPSKLQPAAVPLGKSCVRDLGFSGLDSAGVSVSDEGSLVVRPGPVLRRGAAATGVAAGGRTGGAALEFPTGAVGSKGRRGAAIGQRGLGLRGLARPERSAWLGGAPGKAGAWGIKIRFGSLRKWLRLLRRAWRPDRRARRLPVFSVCRALGGRRRSGVAIPPGSILGCSHWTR